MHLEMVKFGLNLSTLKWEKLIQLLVSLRKRGGKVIFDSNHSSKNWSSDDLARAVYTKFLQVTDISLPSFVDEADLFQDRAVEDLIARHHAFGIREVVVKNGTGANWLSTKPDKKPREFPLESIQKAIDNSGVGDAFNAAKLRRSRQRIQNLGYFGKVDFSKRRGSDNTKTVIDVKLEEQKTLVET